MLRIEPRWIPGMTSGSYVNFPSLGHSAYRPDPGMTSCFSGLMSTSRADPVSP